MQDVKDENIKLTLVHNKIKMALEVCIKVTLNPLVGSITLQIFTRAPWVCGVLVCSVAHMILARIWSTSLSSLSL